MVRAPTSAGTEGSLLVAPADGVVKQSFWHVHPDGTGAGHVVQIDHGGLWFTTYIHLQSRAVSVGQQVYQGQPIGRVGHTGTTSNGVPHLHFELAIDSNGDGRAIWGGPGERVRPWFNGAEYGQSNGQTWRSVYSNNCGEMPAATSSGGRMDVFVRGTNREIWQNTYTSSWSGWRSTGPAIASSAPGAVAWTDNNGNSRIDLFANGAENANGVSDVYWQSSYDGGVTWGPWQWIGGNLTTQPAVTTLNGTLYLFGRGTDHRLWSRKLVPTWQPQFGEWDYSWNGWEPRTNDRLNSAPTATRFLDQVQVWYTRQDLRPYQVFTTSAGPWVGPIAPGGSVGNLTGAMGIMQWSDDFEVYGRGTDAFVWFKWYDHAGGWRDWRQQTSLGIANSGVGATNHAGNTNLFIKGPNDQIKWTRWDASVGGWRSWTDLGGQTL